VRFRTDRDRRSRYSPYNPRAACFLLSYVPGEQRNTVTSLGTILLIVLILMLVGVLPVWPHASSWGYGPSGIVGVILVVVLVLFLSGRL
jgi:uncharacterized protein DUF3309